MPSEHDRKKDADEVDSAASATPDDTMCFCFHISRPKIVNYVKRERPRRASLISQCFGAGSGCGWCIPFLIQLHEDIMGDEVLTADMIGGGEYEAMRKRYLIEVREGKRKRNSLEGVLHTPESEEEELDSLESAEPDDAPRRRPAPEDEDFLL